MLFDRKPAAPQEDLANLKITDARVKDTLSVTGAAEDFSDIDFTVDRCDRYEAGSKRWTELSGTWRNRRVFLEVHNEDTVEVLGSFDGQQDHARRTGAERRRHGAAGCPARTPPIFFSISEGKFLAFTDSAGRWAFFSERGAATGRGFYGWEFHEQDGKRFLSVRKF